MNRELQLGLVKCGIDMSPDAVEKARQSISSGGFAAPEFGGSSFLDKIQQIGTPEWRKLPLQDRREHIALRDQISSTGSKSLPKTIPPWLRGDNSNPIAREHHELKKRIARHANNEAVDISRTWNKATPSKPVIQDTDAAAPIDFTPDSALRKDRTLQLPFWRANNPWAWTAGAAGTGLVTGVAHMAYNNYKDRNKKKKKEKSASLVKSAVPKIRPRVKPKPTPLTGLRSFPNKGVRPIPRQTPGDRQVFRPGSATNPSRYRGPKPVHPFLVKKLEEKLLTNVPGKPATRPGGAPRPDALTQDVGKFLDIIRRPGTQSAVNLVRPNKPVWKYNPLAKATRPFDLGRKDTLFRRGVNTALSPLHYGGVGYWKSPLGRATIASSAPILSYQGYNAVDAVPSQIVDEFAASIEAEYGVTLSDDAKERMLRSIRKDAWPAVNQVINSKLNPYQIWGETSPYEDSVNRQSDLILNLATNAMLGEARIPEGSGLLTQSLRGPVSVVAGQGMNTLFNQAADGTGVEFGDESREDLINYMSTLNSEEFLNSDVPNLAEYRAAANTPVAKLVRNAGGVVAGDLQSQAKEKGTEYAKAPLIDLGVKEEDAEHIVDQAATAAASGLSTGASSIATGARDLGQQSIPYLEAADRIHQGQTTTDAPWEAVLSNPALTPVVIPVGDKESPSIGSKPPGDPGAMGQPGTQTPPGNMGSPSAVDFTGEDSHGLPNAKSGTRDVGFGKDPRHSFLDQFKTDEQLENNPLVPRK